MSRPGGLRGAVATGRLLGAATSGALLVLAFPGPDLGWLAWVALVPLLLSIEGLRPPQAFLVGCAAGLVAFGGLMRWIAVFGYPAWILLSSGMALYMGLFSASAQLLGRGRRTAALWAVPLCWVAVEAVRSWGPLGFPWGLLGLTQHSAPAVLPVASLSGVFGLSGLIAATNALLAAAAGALLEARPPAGGGAALRSAAGRRGFAALAGAALLLGAVLLVGGLPGSTSPSGSIRVAVIQPNVPPRPPFDGSAAPGLLEDLLGLTARAAEAGADLIVYPESAVPRAPEPEEGLRELIARRAGGAVVVVGAHLPGPTNGAVVIGAGGAVLGKYEKRRLVPFGEAGLQPGRPAAPVETPLGRIGLAVCYESAFSGDFRRVVRSGADLLVVLTNDGWFGRSAGPAQHAAHSVLRAVETGRGVVRAANTGVSMIIGPEGAPGRVLPLGTSGVLVRTVPVGGETTFYVRAGWLLGPLAVAVWLLGMTPWAVAAVRRQPARVAALAAAIALPALPLVLERLLDPGAVGTPGLLVSAAVLVACMATGRGHLFNRRGTIPGGAAGAVLVGLLILAMRAAYASHGFDMPLQPPAGGWVVGGARLVVGGIATEAWLRGAVFGRAEGIGGWVLGTALSTALGVMFHLGGPQELLFWHLLTGVAFGLIRTRSLDAAGLGPARGLGDAAVRALAGLR